MYYTDARKAEGGRSRNEEHGKRRVTKKQGCDTHRVSALRFESTDVGVITGIVAAVPGYAVRLLSVSAL